MKKTKIICSIGPSCNDAKVLSEMAIHGMNAARINFSHGTYADKDKMVENILEARKLAKKEIAILWDTRGPEFRTGSFKNDAAKLETDGTVKIVKGDVLGDNSTISVNHDEALKKINVGNTLLVDDGKMRLEVIGKHKDELECKILVGGVLTNNKSISVPGVDLDLPYVSKQDKKDIEYACRNDGEFLAISFVSSKDNVLEIRKILKEYNREDLKIICKIESKLGLENLDEILEVCDGIMVARGDLGTEMPSEKLPILQKQIIKKARRAGKLAIVATEMLESMLDEVRPKRSETSDIANAVLDGTDAVMLSAETAIGDYPVRTVSAMGRICNVTEEYATFNYIDDNKALYDETSAIAEAVVDTSNRLHAKLICASTISGDTACEISNLKPDAYILALCPNSKVRRKLALNWGVYTKVVPFYNSTDEVLIESVKSAKEFMGLQKDDILITTGSFPSTGESHPTNLMKIEKIK